MAFHPVEDAALVVIEYGAEAVLWTNTMWFTQNGFGAENMDDLQALMAAWSDTYIMPELSSAWNRESVTIYDMREEGGLKLVNPVQGAAGGGGANPSPISAACVVTFYTNLRGRSGRGRNYVAGFDELVVDSLNISSSVTRAAIEDAYNLIPALAGAAFWTWVVAQRWSNKVELETGVTHPIISASVRKPELGTQRRRIARG